MILPGFVKKVMSYGIFIEFSSGIFGLAPNSVSLICTKDILKDERTDAIACFHMMIW